MSGIQAVQNPPLLKGLYYDCKAQILNFSQVLFLSRRGTLVFTPRNSIGLARALGVHTTILVCDGSVHTAQSSPSGGLTDCCQFPNMDWHGRYVAAAYCLYSTVIVLTFPLSPVEFIFLHDAFFFFFLTDSTPGGLIVWKTRTSAPLLNLQNNYHMYSSKITKKTNKKKNRWEHMVFTSGSWQRSLYWKFLFDLYYVGGGVKIVANEAVEWGAGGDSG